MLPNIIPRPRAYLHSVAEWLRDRTRRAICRREPQNMQSASDCGEETVESAAIFFFVTRTATLAVLGACYLQHSSGS